VRERCYLRAFGYGRDAAGQLPTDCWAIEPRSGQRLANAAVLAAAKIAGRQFADRKDMECHQGPPGACKRWPSFLVLPRRVWRRGKIAAKSGRDGASAGHCSEIQRTDYACRVGHPTTCSGDLLVSDGSRSVGGSLFDGVAYHELPTARDRERLFAGGAGKGWMAICTASGARTGGDGVSEEIERLSRRGGG